MPACLTQGAEDFARHKADNDENGRVTTVASPAWDTTPWAEIIVGDLIQLKKGDAVPADLVLVATAGESGQCWVETKELDGESNLKPRWAVKSCNGCTAGALHGISAQLDVESPSEDLEEINGSMVHVGGYDSGVIEARNCIWRGSRLMSDWAHGFVIYTGGDLIIAYMSIYGNNHYYTRVSDL